MNSETSTIQTIAQANKTTAESVENISAMKHLLKIKTYKTTFRQISRHFVSGSFEKSRVGCTRIAGVTSSEELGTMSKNNLRGITLGIRPIPRIHSLTLIIS